MSKSEVQPATKSERTRALIRDVALRSFRERGYDATTIRLIAQEAGVSVGTTNYHFASKNDLVQELYLDVQVAHRDAAAPLLAETTDLVERLGVVFRTGLAQLEPYHRFAPEFLSASMSPRSSMNPLSEESSPARDIDADRNSDANRWYGSSCANPVRNTTPSRSTKSVVSASSGAAASRCATCTSR